MLLSLLFSVLIVREHLCCIYDVSVSERSKVNCAMVGGKTKGDRLIHISYGWNIKHGDGG